MSFPFAVLVAWILDAVLAAVYLKWLHPWRILLQEVTFVKGEVRQSFCIDPKFISAPNLDKSQKAIFTEKPRSL